jgi:transcriptional regulator with XRE-family HTH domain
MAKQDPPALPRGEKDSTASKSPGKELGEYLRRRRERMGWSLQKAADEIGISRMYLWKLETRGSNPSMGVLQKLAQAYGVSLPDLLGLVETEFDRVHKKFKEAKEGLQKAYAFRSDLLETSNIEDMKKVIEMFEGLGSGGPSGGPGAGPGRARATPPRAKKPKK